MSVVAPISALLAAAVPAVIGLGEGERPPPPALIGIALALAAIVLVSRDDATDTQPAPSVHLVDVQAPSISAAAPPRRPDVGAREQPVQADMPERMRSAPLVLALASGLTFGLFFVTIDQAPDDAGIWPLVAARLASVTLFALLGAARVTATDLPRGVAPAAAGCGLLDAAANVLYLLALSGGLLSVVSVLTALYPAATVLLARIVLREEIAGARLLGLATAVLAAVLIAM
jgi:drug/metabolite transporter (DMT)-like permease